MKSRKNYVIGYFIISIIFVIVFVFFTMVTGISPTFGADIPLKAKTDISLNSFDATYEINEDGSALVTEIWDTKFSGGNSYTIMSKVIDLYSTGSGTSLSPEDINLISVREPSEDKDYSYEEPRSDDLRAPYTFTMVKTPSSVALEWKEAFHNENRVFEIKYEIIDFVNLYNDTAEIYWKFIPDENSMDIMNFNTVIKLPDSAAGGEIKFWGHGNPVNDIVNSNVSRAGNEIIYKADYAKSYAYIESRVVLPRESFTGGNVIDRDNLANVLSEEQAWADKTNKDIFIARAIAFVDIAVAIVLAVIAIIVVLSLFRKHTRHEPEFKGDYYHKPPADLNPTTVHRLYNFYGNVSDSVDLSTTMLNLAYKKHINIESRIDKPSQISIRVISSEYSGSLTAIEKPLLNIINDAAASKPDRVVSMKELNRYVTKHQEKSNSRLIKLTESADADFDAKNFVDTGSISANKASSLSGIGIIILGAFMAFQLINSLGIYFTPLVLMLFGLALLIFGSTFKRLNEQGQNEYAKWYAFGNYMSDFSLLNEREAPEFSIWEKYMIYATAMGIAERVMSQLMLAYPEISNPATLSPTTNIYRTAAMINFMNSGGMNRLNSGMKSLRTAATPTSDGSGSGGGGFGGGFSGGGGGGGGGGSMGGR